MYPNANGAPLSIVLMIQMYMLFGRAFIVLFTVPPAAITKNDVFRSGMAAIVAVYGVA
ncbi:anaerobic C4-dicarboxylate transporter family protein [Sodalis sp.]|uniref:anaerobic C4-dicarboxylate transporter family protein n=1 Tax=Sodalis sp. (in: enterobacteria) TaxID=1898979 RepID=UPI00387338C7